MVVASVPSPPVFLDLAADPIRWGLLRELSRSDRPVEELAAAVERPQNLVSYHLGRLRAAELVSARRSSHDRRRTYYRLNLERCARLLSEAGRALHPGLITEGPQQTGAAPQMTASVLFLCTENSARSQMAEALLRAAAPGSVVASAGTRPTGVHPYAVIAMQARGLDISAHRSKHLADFDGSRFDRVITVCDHVNEGCPEFSGAPLRLHWSVADPAAGEHGAPRYADFERTAQELAERVRFLLPLLGGPA